MNAGQQTSSLRLSASELAALLDKMDTGESPTEPNARRSSRYRYRAFVAVEINTRDRIVRTAVACRNISRDGAAFLCGHFVYPGSACRVRLVSEYNFATTVDANVVRCRYVPGTAGVYEVGVSFASPIDVALFHREGASARVLLVDSDDLQRELLCSFFRKSQAQVDVAQSAAEMLDKATSNTYELVVVNHGMADAKACDLVRDLRETGYARPMLCIACRPPAGGELKCDHGGELCELIPLTREGVQAISARLRNEPITSRLAHDPHMAEVIDLFVERLPEEITVMQAVYAGGDREELAKRAARLSALAEGSGFDVIADAAKRLAALAAGEGPAAALRPAFSDLVQLCFAARPASQARRGSMSGPG